MFEWTLTGISFSVHVRFAAGLEFFEVQFARRLSPTWYRCLIPWMIGRFSGTSTEIIIWNVFFSRIHNIGRYWKKNKKIFENYFTFADLLTSSIKSWIVKLQYWLNTAKRKSSVDRSINACKLLTNDFQIFSSYFGMKRWCIGWYLAAIFSRNRCMNMS